MSFCEASGFLLPRLLLPPVGVSAAALGALSPYFRASARTVPCSQLSAAPALSDAHFPPEILGTAPPPQQQPKKQSLLYHILDMLQSRSAQARGYGYTLWTDHHPNPTRRASRLLVCAPPRWGHLPCLYLSIDRLISVVFPCRVSLPVFRPFVFPSGAGVRGRPGREREYSLEA